MGPLNVSGVARVEVPFLGYIRRISEPLAQLEIRIAPRPLPERFP
jgi:hypothetical protein